MGALHHVQPVHLAAVLGFAAAREFLGTAQEFGIVFRGEKIGIEREDDIRTR